MIYKQDPPFALKVELTESCNLRCSFCSLNAIRGKEHNYKFMEQKTIINLFKQVTELGWNPRVEIDMHGEPSMHPDYIRMIAKARKYAPNLQITLTSNGGGLLKPPGIIANIQALFDAGLNVLALDDYEGIRICTKVRDALHIDPLNGVDVYEYPANKEGNPHMRRPKSARVITLIQDISKATTGTHSNLTNQGGTAFPPDKSMHGKRCAKPFRELSVRWDGSVAICCDDWRGVYKCGNINEISLGDIWNGPEFRSARRALYHGRRDLLSPCKGCNVRSYRPGLLPDKFGKITLKEPQKHDLEVMKQAMSGKPYTAPVLREWEKK